MALTASALTDAMENAMQQEWQRAKGSPLPAVGQEDRRLLFAAVARGILDFLKDNENEFVTELTVRDEGNTRRLEVTGATINYSGE